jgi:site-specific recombinase XerD
MKRQVNPPLSTAGEFVLAQYDQALREQEDLTPASLRKYLSDLRHFLAWYEACAAECAPDTLVNSWFDLSPITTPTLTRSRTSLQTVHRRKPASVNRLPVRLKRYCGWAIQHHFITYDPSRAVKLVGEVENVPRHLEDHEKQRFLAAVTKEGSLRDRALIFLLLHTGLRAREVCQLRDDQVKLGKRISCLFKERSMMCNKQLKPWPGQHESLLGGASGWDDVSLPSYSSGPRRILHDAR